MIRGNIEQVTSTSISGWLYADVASVRDRTVLAFLDDRCVGAGRVEHFRQDLADAGLADGILGFHFPIVLPAAADAPRVTVRLEESDAVLVQRHSRVVGADEGQVQSQPAGPRRSLSSLHWMRVQGWLDQSQYDFLKYIDQLGVYERSLRQPKRAGEVSEQANLDPEATALGLFELYYMDEVSLQQHKIESVNDLLSLAQQSAALGGFEPLVALWSEERVRIAVTEGSHRQAAGQSESGAAEAGIEYYIGPDHLLLLNPRCAFAPNSAAPAGGITVLVAAAR